MEPKRSHFLYNTALALVQICFVTSSLALSFSCKAYGSNLDKANASFKYKCQDNPKQIDQLNDFHFSKNENNPKFFSISLAFSFENFAQTYKNENPDFYSGLSPPKVLQ